MEEIKIYCKNHTIDEHAFDEITPESAYWIGFLMADGCVLEKSNTVAILLSSKDYNHLEKFKNYVKSNNKITMRSNQTNFYSKYGSCSFHVGNAHIKNTLQKYGILPHKSLTAKIGDERLLFNRDFWRGVVDGNGCITLEKVKAKNSTIKDSYHYPYIQLGGTKNIVENFANYVEKITSTKYHKCIKELASSYHTIHFGGRNAYDVINSIYENPAVCLERKHNIYAEMRRKIQDGLMFCGQIKKLSDKDIITIRNEINIFKRLKRSMEETRNEIAINYGVSERLISDIIYNNYRC